LHLQKWLLGHAKDISWFCPKSFLGVQKGDLAFTKNGSWICKKRFFKSAKQCFLNLQKENLEI